jgi:HSP20 family protein
MTILMDPVAPWLRDRTFTSESGPAPFVPPADVLVTDGDVTVVMDVPGLRPEDLEIEFESDTLTVRGERPVPYGDDSEGQRRLGQRIERAFGRFERSLRVPAGSDPGSVQASLTNGVLTLKVPRPQPPQPKHISIAGADDAQAQT